MFSDKPDQTRYYFSATSVFLADNPHFLFLNASEIARELRPENFYGARFDAERQFLERLEEMRRKEAEVVL